MTMEELARRYDVHRRTVSALLRVTESRDAGWD